MRINNLKKYIANLPGWKTKRKIIVIESDDWGSVRMPSRKAYNLLKGQGVDLDSNGYASFNMNDTLASKDDLEALFEILENVKDKNGNSCIVTALSVVANPDFKRIKEEQFRHYYYESFKETLERYYPGHKVFKTWEEGISKKVFYPQFHGREHLNIINWMNLLRNGHRDTVLTFERECWGYSPGQINRGIIENQAAFQLTSKEDVLVHEKILDEGLTLFESIFGYKAKYFVPPNGPFNNLLNNILVKNGIKYRSSAKLQKESIDLNKVRNTIKWLGKKDKSGLIYITRNCFFEPSLSMQDSVDSCLSDIKLAFRFNKPAIISSHRANYVGSLNSKNRDNTLYNLKILLAKIRKQWPTIEFFSTVELGDLILNSHLSGGSYSRNN